MRGHARWSKRNLSAKRYIYFWVDGIHVRARLEGTAQCLLIIIEATSESEGACRPQRRYTRKCAILAGIAFRSEEAWAVDWPQARVRRWRARILANGEGRLAQTRFQRCRMHKIANVLNNCRTTSNRKPSVRCRKPDGRYQDDGLAAFDAFVETWSVKYDKTVECLIKYRDALLGFYDFPVEHWKHLRTTDEMASNF